MMFLNIVHCDPVTPSCAIVVASYNIFISLCIFFAGVTVAFCIGAITFESARRSAHRRRRRQKSIRSPPPPASPLLTSRPSPGNPGPETKNPDMKADCDISEWRAISIDDH